MKNSLIITGGMFYESFACRFCREHSFDVVIAADRGAAYADALGIRPDYVLGDFDSFDRKPEARVEIDRFPAAKDATDTELAVGKAIALGSDSITILCGGGARMDHFLANVGMLALCCERGVRAFLIDPWNRIRMVRKECVIRKEEQYGAYVSLLPYSEKVTGITLDGFRYPLRNAVLDRKTSLGVSNEIAGEAGSVRFDDGLLLVIESKDGDE